MLRAVQFALVLLIAGMETARALDCERKVAGTTYRYKESFPVAVNRCYAARDKLEWQKRLYEHAVRCEDGRNSDAYAGNVRTFERDSATFCAEAGITF